MTGRGSALLRPLAAAMPLVGNWDDHDFGPNNYFGLGSSAALPDARSMLTKASFDVRVASRAYKWFWPSRAYGEWDGARGVESATPLSPLVDLFVTDTRYYAKCVAHTHTHTHTHTPVSYTHLTLPTSDLV